MKKVLFYCILPVLLFACGKGNKSTNPPPNTGNKTYKVQFNVSASGASSLSTNSLRTDASTPVPILSFATKLYYWVYNSAGKLITQLVQDTSTANFGQITDTFAPGNYNIVLVAQSVPTYNEGGLTAPTTFSTGFFYVQGNDTFYDTFPLTVSSSPITQDITLTRDVGQLQIVITDSIPVAANVLNISMSPIQAIKLSTGAVVTEAGGGASLYITLPDSVKGKKNFTITTYIPNATTVPFKILLQATNSANATIASATVDSVTTTVNERTIVSGNLFNHEANIGFTVTLNDAWDTTPIIIPFNQRQKPPIKKAN